MAALMVLLYLVYLPDVSGELALKAVLRLCAMRSEMISAPHRYFDLKLLCWHRVRLSPFANYVPQTHLDHCHCMSHHLWYFFIPCIIGFDGQLAQDGLACYISSFEADLDEAIHVIGLRIHSLHPRLR